MTKENPKIKSVLKSHFQGAIDKLIREHPSSSISTLYIQFDPESGEVQVYDEREHLLQKKVIFDWIGADIKDHPFMSKMHSVFRHVLEMLTVEGAFQHALFIRPFTVYSTDEEFKQRTEVYTLPDDDDLSSGEGTLMKGLDKELDVFLKKLLSDIE